MFWGMDVNPMIITHPHLICLVHPRAVLLMLSFCSHVLWDAGMMSLQIPLTLMAAGADADPSSAGSVALIPTSPKSVEACFRLGIGKCALAVLSQPRAVHVP